MKWYESDSAIDEHYARDYYGKGTNYFEPPEYDDCDEDDEDWDEEE